MGLYFVEKGANQRPSTVIYDREYSSIALTPPSDYDWEAIFAGASWLHLSGITPALSENAFKCTKYAARAAQAQGLKVSCDLNFRKKLWRWSEGTSANELAGRSMRELLPNVDLVIANEEDAADVLGIHPEGNDVNTGTLAIDRYPVVAAEIHEQFPNISQIAITLRESISASHNNWGAMLYDVAHNEPHFAPMVDNRYAPYQIRNMIDRVGGGDSFAAGLIYALNTPELAVSKDAIRFAVAASCLAHSVEGDFNFNSRAEVERLMGGNASGRVVR